MTRTPRRQPHAASGFSLIELLAVLAAIGIVAAMAVPLFTSGLDLMRLDAARRDVQSELQTARLKAVSARHAMRVRFNCPAAGYFRMVEVVGTPTSPASADSDTNTDRCKDGSSYYPYPSKSTDELVRPVNDGPLRQLQPGASFAAAQTIEFWPDGTAHASSGSTIPWPYIPATGVTISISRKSVTKSLTVNGVGRITIQ
jgi:prepilin-type N-terminal cleavage/methylation domain-containing protein